MGITLIPLPEQFFAGGGNSHRGFGLNQAGPSRSVVRFPGRRYGAVRQQSGTTLSRDDSALSGGRIRLRHFSRYGQRVYRATRHVEGLDALAPTRSGAVFAAGGTRNLGCYTQFNNSGYDYTSQALGVGLRYKTPIGPLRFDFGYNLNPTRYFQALKFDSSGTTD